MADAPLCSDGLRYGQAGSCMNVCGGKVPMQVQTGYSVQCAMTAVQEYRSAAIWRTESVCGGTKRQSGLIKFEVPEITGE